jgi:EpsI family protein
VSGVVPLTQQISGLVRIIPQRARSRLVLETSHNKPIGTPHLSDALLTDSAFDSSSRIQTVLVWAAAAALLLAFWLVYYPTVLKLTEYWATNDTYSYGFLVPFISAFLVWLRRDLLRQHTRQPSLRVGGLVLGFGLLMFIVGTKSSTNLIEELSLPVTVSGLVILMFGTRIAQSLTFPLAYLFTMIPFWDFLTRGLQEPFQLYSAIMGVGALRLLNIPVFREGVIIYLPDITLEVADVCSGVNNLVAVLCIGVPLTHLYIKGWLKRSFVIVSAVLIALLSNGVRVAIVSLFAFYGIRGANGDIHGPFSLARSLLISGIGFVVLFWLISIFANKHPVSNVSLAGIVDKPRKRSATLISALGLAVVMLVGSIYVDRWYTVTPVPLKSDLVSFPSSIGRWQLLGAGSFSSTFAKIGFDETLSRRYIAEDGGEIELLIGYFASQQQGRELAGPEMSALVPAFESASTAPVEGAIKVKDYLTSTGSETYHVTYWYLVGGEVASERYQAKWKTSWNAVIRRRSDGGLVVVRTRINGEDSIDASRQKVRDFLQGVIAASNAYFQKA